MQCKSTLWAKACVIICYNAVKLAGDLFVLLDNEEQIFCLCSCAMFQSQVSTQCYYSACISIGLPVAVACQSHVVFKHNTSFDSYSLQSTRDLA